MTTIKVRHPNCDAVISFRVDCGMTQQQFASAIGVAISTLARWETSLPPTGKSLLYLADAAIAMGKKRHVLAFCDLFAEEAKRCVQERIAEAGRRDIGVVSAGLASLGANIFSTRSA